MTSHTALSPADHVTHVDVKQTIIRGFTQAGRRQTFESGVKILTRGRQNYHDAQWRASNEVTVQSISAVAFKF